MGEREGQWGEGVKACWGEDGGRRESLREVGEREGDHRRKGGVRGEREGLGEEVRDLVRTKEVGNVVRHMQPRSRL